ncbi:MAG: hypothetical protein HQL78_07815 [Magnetococcales bacterium]|nr:hypothetical protein [Magnetococcales bacterium]
MNSNILTDVNEYLVRISDHALMELVLAAVEGYTVKEAGHSSKPGRKPQFVETIGLLWGHTARVPYNRLLLNVENVTVDAMANKKSGSVLPAEGEFVKRDFITSFWPHLQFLGEFHSHPYKDINDVKACQGYLFSPGDRKRIETNIDEGEPYLLDDPRVHAVVTVASLKRRVLAPPMHITENTIEFTLGAFRFWITVYVACTLRCEQNESGKIIINRDPEWPSPEKVFNNTIFDNFTFPDVSLQIPSLVGLEELSQLGKMKGKEFHPGDI